MITKSKILAFQHRWGNGIVSISNTFMNNGDYIEEAKVFLRNLYAYETDKVLFKPTLAADAQFRFDEISALSYLVGCNSNFSEDSGFAIKGWNNVRWDNAGINIMQDCVICMGNYYFSMENKSDFKVEYSLVLKEINGNLKIILHDSHIPYHK